MRILPLALSLLMICVTVAGQFPQGLQVTVYNQNNGIRNGKVTAMLQGKNGYLWFGTTNGLLRFDGYGFREYNDAAVRNTITALAEDSNHCIWMSFLGGGLASFNPAQDVFTAYKLQNGKDATLSHAEVHLLFFDSKQQLWLGIVQKGLVQATLHKNTSLVYNVADHKNTTYTPEIRKVYNTVYAIHEDDQGLLWLATHDGLYRFNRVTKEMLAVREKPVQNTADRLDLFLSILATGDTLWMSAWGGGISRYNKRTNEWKHYLPTPEKVQDPVYNIVVSIAHKSRDELWVCSVDRGLGLFIKSLGRFVFDQPDARSALSVFGWVKFIIDKDQNIWGITHEGLKKISLPDHPFFYTTFAITKKLKSKFNLTDSWEDDTLLLTGTSFADGLHIQQKLTGKTSVLSFDVMNGEDPAPSVRRIMKDSRNNIWVLTRDFIYLYDRVKNVLKKIRQPPGYTSNNISNNFTNLAEDKEGNLWFTTRRNGVFLYNTSAGIYRHYGPQEKGSFFLNAAYIATIAVDAKSRVWLGGPFDYLGYTDPAGKQIIQLRADDTLRLPGTQTLSLIADRMGNIWAGTYNGLYHFDCTLSTPVLQKIISSKDGLRSNQVNHVAQDADGNTWCITEAAVCRIDARTNQVTSYDERDGITEGGMGNKIVFTSDNKLRLLAINGHYNFQALPAKTGGHTPPLVITKMTANDKEIYFEKIIKKGGPVELSPSQNVFSFEFAAIDFKAPERQQYRYKLEGFDADWIDAGNRRFVTYTNLPGGNYKFFVQATANPGEWSGAAKEIPLHVLNVFYKTTWFTILVIALIAVVLFLFYSFRLRQTRSLHRLQLQATRLEKDKTEIQYQNLINQFNPHFLFNSLTSLNSLIYENKELASEFLEQLSTVYRYLLTHKETQLVTLAEEAAFIKPYIALLKTRFENGLQIQVDLPQHLLQKKVVPVTFQLMIENALKHNRIDADTPLVISITVDEQYLYFSNNLQRKTFVETSNRKGLESLQRLYKYLSSLPLVAEENEEAFIIKVPLL